MVKGLFQVKGEGAKHPGAVTEGRKRRHSPVQNIAPGARGSHKMAPGSR